MEDNIPDCYNKSQKNHKSEPISQFSNIVAIIQFNRLVMTFKTFF